MYYYYVLVADCCPCPQPSLRNGFLSNKVTSRVPTASSAGIAPAIRRLTTHKALRLKLCGSLTYGNNTTPPRPPPRLKPKQAV